MSAQYVERILVIDDQKVFRKKLELSAAELGYQADSAESGQAGLEKLRSGKFDLLLLDIMMPGMDGFEVMQLMKEDSRLREIPIVVISALDGDLDAVVRAIEFGAQDFLPKNFDPVLLAARLSSSLEKKRNRDRELEHLQQVERLTQAAVVLESGIVDPKCTFKNSGRGGSASVWYCAVGKYCNRRYLHSSCGLPWQTAQIQPIPDYDVRLVGIFINGYC